MNIIIAFKIALFNILIINFLFIYYSKFNFCFDFKDNIIYIFNSIKISNIF